MPDGGGRNNLYLFPSSTAYGHFSLRLWLLRVLCFDVKIMRMQLPSTTSRLLALQEDIIAELRLRLGEIFQRYRGLAFAGRNDNLFTEHWTPEEAASGYDFDSYEIKGAEMVLHGVENACGFIYRISISFPLELVDSPAAIEAYFQRLHHQAQPSELRHLPRPRRKLPHKFRHSARFK